jgi:hypothetical protein
MDGMTDAVTICNAHSQYFAKDSCAAGAGRAQQTPRHTSSDSERTLAVTPMPCISRSRLDENGLGVVVSACAGFSIGAFAGRRQHPTAAEMNAIASDAEGDRTIYTQTNRYTDIQSGI